MWYDPNYDENNFIYATDYEMSYEAYQKSLERLEACIKGLDYSSTITSLNYSLLNLWLELELNISKFETLHGDLKRNALYAFYNTIDFRGWSKKFRQYSETLPFMDECDYTEDESYLHSQDGIRFTPRNFEADKAIFKRFKDTINNKRNWFNAEEKKELTKISNKVLPGLAEVRKHLDSVPLHCVIEKMLVHFSDLLDAIHRIIIAPDIVSLEALYVLFKGGDKTEKEIDAKVTAYVASIKDNPQFVHLIETEMSKLQRERISRYCNEEEWHNLFSWDDDECQPIYGNIGQLIHKYYDYENRIEIGKDIVELTYYWMQYNWELMEYNIKHEEHWYEKREREKREQLLTEKAVNSIVLITNKELHCQFVELIKDGICKLITQKPQWDYLRYLCIHHHLIQKCSRDNYARFLVSHMPQLGSPTTLANSISKHYISGRDDATRYKQVIADPVGKALDDLLAPIVKANT